MNRQVFTCSLLLIWIVFGCNSSAKNPTPSEDVRIGITSEPDALNPVTSKTIDALVINALLFQKLMDVDFETLKLVPVLAEAPPEVTQENDSLYSLTYLINKNAKWNDGKPVTAADVDFTYKAAILPGINNEGKKNYLTGIRSINQESGNPKKVEFKCRPGMRMIYSTGAEVGIMPAHIYDPDSLISKISFAEIVSNKLDSTDLKNIQTWAEQFNQMFHQRDPKGISGSGSYQLKEWIADQRITLSQKENFWAAESDSPQTYYHHYPNSITYHILTEPSAMIRAAQNGQLDAGPVSRSADFMSLLSDSAFNRQFQLLLAPELSTNVIIMNSCLPELSSVKTRKALAHLFDAEQYITSVQKSTGKRITGPLHPAKSAYLKQEPYSYNLEKAQQLLAEDGWSDSDNDGILDKTADGKKVDLELDYKFNTGNEGRRNAGLLFQEWAKPAGVKINLVNEEWLVFIQSLMSKDFELAFFTWTDEHAPTDPAPIYHSSSIENGYNFGCFSHSRADSLMDVLSASVSETERQEIWHELQRIFHEEVAGIFLSTNDSRFFISRKFKPVKPSALSPGYWAGSLQPESDH